MKNLKNIYLVLVVIFSILAVTLLSTKALFVNVTENNNSVTLETGLNYTFNINGEQQFTLPAGTTLTFSANAVNNMDGAIYYELYYKMISPTTKPSGVVIAEVTDSDLTTSGDLELNGSKSVTLIIKNESSEEVTIKIGLAAGYVGNEIIYTGNEVLITDKISVSEAPEETWSTTAGAITLEDCEKTTVMDTFNGVSQLVDKFVCPSSASSADTSGANIPELFDGMIPVKWDSSNNVVKADKTNIPSNPWYNYDNKMWANAVMVTSSTRETYMNAEVGTTITASDILAYWVWIPRYRYKLFNASFTSGTSPQTIEIEFESPTTEKSTGTTNDTWLTHPAFTFGDAEINGFWIAKFEPSGSATAGNLKVVPGVVSLREQTVGVQYGGSQLFANEAYVTTDAVTKIDSHMLKNVEWGAVAYLSHSIYGVNTEVAINSNSSYYTGGGTGTAYITNNGQSTTGTVYGVYDMSGGAWESVMGNYNNTTGSSGLTVSGLGKYIDVYTGTTVASSKLGDALGETAAWYSDNADFVTSSSPWFIRGGSYNAGTGAGAFNFGSGTGTSYTGGSFRPALIAK